MDWKKLKESQHIEFKRSYGKEVIISLVAFANSEGGKVIVGMDDSGNVTGLDVKPETEQRYLNEIKVSTYPQIIPNIVTEFVDNKTVLVFEINEYPIKPISYKNRYYKRVKNSNHLLTLDEIVSLQQQSLNISFDSYPLKENLTELDLDLLETFVEKVNSKGRINLQDDLFTNLIKLKLIQSGKPSLASMLLFGNHGYSIHIGRFRSEETIIDDLLLKGPLLTALDEAMMFIKKHINLSFEFDGSLERKEKWQYPLEVIRELLLNAIVHRDYKHNSDLVIKIFDNKIIFTNPGRIYGNLTIEDLEQDDYVSSIRNKLLADSFYLIGDIEKYGTGFIRIRKILADYPGIMYRLSEIGDFFKVELADTRSKPTESNKTGQTPDKNRTRTGQEPDKLKLLEYCKKERSVKEMMNHMNLKHRENFLHNYLHLLIQQKSVTMTKPDKPKSPKQKYVITSIGLKELDKE